MGCGGISGLEACFGKRAKMLGGVCLVGGWVVRVRLRWVGGWVRSMVEVGPWYEMRSEVLAKVRIKLFQVDCHF